MDEIKLGTMDLKSFPALQVASQSLEEFINYLKTVDPELEQFEAILLASAFLDKLPTIIQSNQTVLSGLKKKCEFIKQQRPITND